MLVAVGCSKSLTKEEKKVVGSYETKKDENGIASKLVLLENRKAELFLGGNKAGTEAAWKLFEKEDYDSDKEKIYISNYGRVKKEISESEYKLLKLGSINNFETFSYPKKESKKRKNSYVHRELGLLFLKKEEDKRFVIHLNHDLSDNYYKNLLVHIISSRIFWCYISTTGFLNNKCIFRQMSFV
jgi:hypothetical protein